MPDLWTDVLTTAPAAEPVSVEDARRNCDLDDTYRDEDLRRWIVYARRQVEHDARLALINQTRTLTLHAFPAGEELNLPAVAPLVSVTSVTYLDAAGASQTLTENTEFKIDTARRSLWLKYNQDWPDTYGEANSVVIVYVAGHGTTPADVPAAARDAIHVLVRHRLENPEVAIVGKRITSAPMAYLSLINQIAVTAYP